MVNSGSRKADQVVELIRARITDGTLGPGMLAPSGEDLVKETGFAVETCRKAMRLLHSTGELTRMSRSARYRVPGNGPPVDGQEIARALAERRRAAGLTQIELSDKIGMSVTTVGHAETGRLWQSRRFWERADLVLGADGALVALFNAWQAAGSLSGAITREPAVLAAAGVPDVPAAIDEPDVPDGIVITLPCDPVPVTVRWADGSVTTVQPGPV
jgi:DNA-binding transcriptional regulator YhcF (GntR family)